MTAGFAGFFPSTVRPEQPLFNGIAEMSQRSQTEINSKTCTRMSMEIQWRDGVYNPGSLKVLQIT